MHRLLSRRIFAALILLFASQTATAAEPVARVFEQGGKSLPYRFLAPEKMLEGQKYPLLVCLHGAGERGTDNERQVGHFKPLFGPAQREKHPCFVILPQVPGNQIWATYGWSTKHDAMQPDPAPALALAKALVESLLAKEPIDKDRVYVTGLSMGGYGTWEFAQRWPELVAAAAPVCGGGDPTQAARLKSLPVWAFHGDKDTVIRPEASSRMIDAIRAAGGAPKLTIYPGVGHNAWGPAFGDPALLEWLFAQKRSR